LWKRRRGEPKPIQPDDPSNLAAETFAELIKEQLSEERARKSSLEQRGGFVITTAGTLVTLLFGLAAVVTARKTFVVPHDARILLAIALGFFVSAAIGGLLANLPWGYAEVDEAALARLVERDLWQGPILPASRRASEARVEILLSARRANQKKAVAVVAALAGEIVAIAILAAGVGVILV
jgi:hypothetical protein